MCPGDRVYKMFAGATATGPACSSTAPHSRHLPGTAGETAGELTDGDTQDRFVLTPQQVVVARRLAEGLSNAEIARKLFVSGHTARNHTYRVLTKLGISKRARVNSVLCGAEAAQAGL